MVTPTSPAGKTQFVHSKSPDQGRPSSPMPPQPPPTPPTHFSSLATSEEKQATEGRNTTPRVVPEDAPAATSPLSRFRRWLWTTGWGSDTLPRVSVKERVADEQKKARAAESARRREEEAHRLAIEQGAVHRQRELTDKTKKGVVAFINTKGAAATTVSTVNCACTLGWDTQTITLVFDDNPAEGTSAARLGKDYEETITVQELDSRLEELEAAFDKFIVEARPNRYFVRSISANSTVEGDNPLLQAERLEKIITVARKYCEYLLIDTPNVITDDATLRMFRMCDVLVFTANVAEHDSLRRLATSMESLRRKGLRDKVDQAVVIISNLPEGADLQGYRKFLNRVNLSDEIVEYYDFHGPFVGIYHDDEIALNRVVELEAWQRNTRQAYREANIAWLEQLLLAQERHAEQSLPPTSDDSH
jgi:cellulose biosynthesis protein BcsQ